MKEEKNMNENEEKDETIDVDSFIDDIILL